MFSENNTKELILERILSQITNDIDKSEGSFVHDMASVFATELEQKYIDLDSALDITYAETSFGEWLEKRAREHGVLRKDGVKATSVLRVFGTSGATVKAGDMFETEGGLRYFATETASISGEFVDITIEAEDVGTIYNVPADTITVIPNQITGVTSVTNPTPITNGVDVESDEDLLSRYLLKVQSPATSGNANHYKLWALEVQGIGAVKVFPTWNGGGTVKVVAISSERTPITPEKVTELQNHIESVRPIGATVTYQSATAKEINVSVSIQRDTNVEQDTIQSEIEKAITDYLKQIAFNQNYVSFAILGSLILDNEGVIDYSNLTVNNATSNVIIGDEEVAILGSVNITWL